MKGKRFGKLTVVKQVLVPSKVNSNIYKKWLCKCDCGNETTQNKHDLVYGDVVSCGCYNKSFFIGYQARHNKYGTRLYVIWSGMKQRCNNPKSNRYDRYGGRGIKVCDEWQNDFVNFETWSLENGYSDQLTLDRIDTDGDYKPSNCRWADKKTQSRNKSTNRIIKYKNQEKTLIEWCEILGLNYSSVGYRIRNGWNIEKAFETPFRKLKQRT